MVVALHHPQGVIGQVFARHKPRRVLAHTALPLLLQRFELRAARLHAANAQALALPQSVKTQADVLAQHAALGVFDGAGLLGNVAVQKLAKRTLANETNAGRILLGCVRQTNLVGNAAHLGFQQLADGKQRFGQLRLVQAVQKVALVFGRVQPFEQLEQATSRGLAHPGVMARGYFFGAQAHGVV